MNKLICWLKGHNWIYQPWHKVSSCTRCTALTGNRWAR